MTVRSNNLGGARPGAGRKPKMKDTTRTVFYMEQNMKDRLTALAKALSDRRPEGTEAVSASELARLAITSVMHSSTGESIARELRPYLGQSKPDLGTREPFEERVPYTTYMHGNDRSTLNRLVAAANLHVDAGNERVATRGDRDSRIVWSEVARYAIEALLASNATPAARNDFLKLIRPEARM